MAASRALHALLPNTSEQINASNNNSTSNMPDVSLGSLPSSFHSPPPSPNPLQGPRRPTNLFLAPSRLSSSSTTESSEQVLTPPYPRRTSRVNGDTTKTTDATPLSMSRRQSDADDGYFSGSARENGEEEDATPGPSRLRRSTARSSQGGAKGGVNLTLREQEKVIDDVKKENFSLKLKVHFLEERLAQLAPDQMENALKQNINLKIEVQSRGMEIKKLKKLVLDLEKTVDKLQKAGVSQNGGERERRLEEEMGELKEKLRESKEVAKDLKEQLRRWVPAAGTGADEQLAKKYAELEAEHADLEAAMEDAQAQLDEKRDELEEKKEELEETKKEVERMRMEKEVSVGKGRADRMKADYERKLTESEAENKRLNDKVEDLAAELDQQDDRVAALELQLEQAEQRIADRSESRQQVEEERDRTEALKEELDGARDKLTAVTLELEEREAEIAEMEEALAAKDDEIHQRLAEQEEENDRAVEALDQEWRIELETLKAQMDDVQSALDEREEQNKRLQDDVAELERMQQGLQDRCIETVAEVEEREKLKEAELEEARLELVDANGEIQRLGQRVQQLESALEVKTEECEENEDRVAARDRALAESHEMHDHVLAALKDKLAESRAETDAVKDLYEEARQTLLESQSRIEELEQQIRDLEADLAEEQDNREQAESVRDEAEDRLAREEQERRNDAQRRQKEKEEDEEHWRRVIADKEIIAERLRDEIKDAQSRLTLRELDVNTLQSALNETRKQGETQSTDRFTLQLEVDRLKRDLIRCEDDLERARRELDKREDTIRERETVVTNLHADNRELASQLAAQTQARLNISDKLDIVQQNLRTAESERASYHTRVQELEQRLSKDQRALLSNEQQYRDQLTERNTLLLTIYQHLEGILGADKTPRKGALPETKPFTNFPVFHDMLIKRLHALSQISQDLERRCKEIEQRFEQKLSDLKKQLDQKLRQIDKFEVQVKGAVEAKQTWRRKLSTKEGELDAMKASNAELAAQLGALKRGPASETASELKSMTARAVNAERRLANALNQAAAAEEKVTMADVNTASASKKWEARVKEYEAMIRAADEKVKRERQGAKERVKELEEKINSLQRGMQQADRRNAQLQEVIDSAPPNSTPPRR